MCQTFDLIDSIVLILCRQRNKDVSIKHSPVAIITRYIQAAKTASASVSCAEKDFLLSCKNTDGVRGGYSHFVVDQGGCATCVASSYLLLLVINYLTASEI